jgi:putative ABC transport system ATP-binding protein
VSVLSAKDLYRFFHTETDEVIALRGVSLDVEAGELVVVLGPSGSGKSTLLACLGGLDEPDGGAVFVCGERLTRRSERAKAELRARLFGVVLQSNNLVEHLTVRENVVLALRLAHKRGAGRAAAVIERLGIGDRAWAHPSELSGGEAVRAAVAVAVAAEPTVVLADEPTAEVDAGNEAEIAQLMRDATRDGAAVVVATHSERLAGFADRVVRLLDGAVVHD